MYYYGPMTDNTNASFGIFTMVFWVIVLTIVVYVVFRLLRNHENTINSKQDPLDIAKERYAKGDIKKEEYEQLKKDLS
jgi:putative membrane protein